ncbi:MAG: NAD(P)/FAD-dependent oxidoreductase [Chloroflexota bacterium]
MTDFDIMIIGASPAGSAAAYFLAKAGVAVCIVDKASFPRDKTSGDWLKLSSLAVLNRMGLDEWVDQYKAPDTILVSSPDHSAVEVTLPQIVDRTRIIPHLELDNRLLAQAQDAGAELLEETIPIALNGLGTKTVTLLFRSKQTDQPFKLNSKIIVAADGANGSFTEQLGLIKDKPDLVSVRAYFEDVDTSDNLMSFHYDPGIMQGYGWIFPLNDNQVNVGLGTYAARTKQQKNNLQNTLQKFLFSNPHTKKRLGNGRMIGKVVGFPIRSSMGKSVPYADNIMVVGEAAGMVDPATGDGIGEAIESGEAAAQEALRALEANNFSASQFAPYGNLLRKKYRIKHQTAAVMRNIVTYQAFLNRAIRRAQVDQRFALELCRTVLGHQPYTAMLSPRNLGSLILG